MYLTKRNDDMDNIFSRTKMLLGDDLFSKIQSAHVAIFGIGGVGGYVAESLARAGVLKLDLIDNDIVSSSNINRQIIATTSTVGKPKVDVMKQRLLDINPDISVNVFNTFFNSETKNNFDFKTYDYIVDAIDTVSSKIELILCAKDAGVKIISSMGTGNKLEPTKLEVSDIYKTSVCPLARIMRYELKKRNVKELKVVFSKEEPVKIPEERQKFSSSNKPIPGSISFVPSSAGLIIASEIIKDIINS